MASTTTPETDLFKGEDAAAVLACSDPDLFGLEHTGLRVSQDGETLGATLADPTRPKVAVATGINADATLSKLKTHIAALH